MANNLIDMTEVMLSTEFTQPVKVYRKQDGHFVKGKFVQTEETFVFDMVVSAVNEKEINMIPEGDRIQDAKTFHCIDELFTTQDTDEEARTSDELEWKNNRYKIVSLTDNSDYGFYKAFGVRIRGY